MLLCRLPAVDARRCFIISTTSPTVGVQPDVRNSIVHDNGETEEGQSNLSSA